MKLPAIIFTALLFACSSQSGEQKPQVNATTCPEERPQICTYDYRPVCATRDTGIRCVTTPCPSTEQATYGNACSACADKRVVSHVPGECAARDEPGK